MILAAALSLATWHSITPVSVDRKNARSSFVCVRIPALEIAPDAEGAYPDVRVVDPANAEIPFALDPAHRTGAATRPVALIDTGFVRGRGSQAVLDLGANASTVDGITLEIDADREPTYFESLAIDASDDRSTWREIRTGAIVYRVAQDGGRGNQTISVPATRSRWLRVRVLDAHAPFPIAGATIGTGGVAPQALVPLAPLVPAYSYDATTHVQTWTFAPPVAVRASALTLVPAAGLGTFSRPVHVETSDDAASWEDAGDGTIARFADGTAQTSFGFDARTARVVRVTIANGDDQPLPMRPVLLAAPHVLVFAVRGTRPYRILSGDPDAHAPAYDLGERLAHASWSATPATAGRTVANAAYRAPVSPADRSWIVTAASIAIGLGLAVVAIRTIRRTGAGGDEGA